MLPNPARLAIRRSECKSFWRSFFRHSSQFSTRRPGTFLKSRKLADKSKASFTKAIAAILSMVATRILCFRNRLNSAAALSSKPKNREAGKQLAQLDKAVIGDYLVEHVSAPVDFRQPPPAAVLRYLSR
jgi:hypothetical protein